MAERPAVIAQLAKVLAGLYADRASTERLARSAGLDITLLAFDARALNTWSAIVQEAQFQDRLETLLGLVSGEYPNYGPLGAAVQAYRDLAAAPPAPQSTAAGSPAVVVSGQVFLSYSRVDREYVATLAGELERRGFTVWYDDRIDLGHRWWRTIERQIEVCAAMVVVMSPEARDSEWVEREIMLAQRDKKPILPLLLRGKGLSLLINQQYADVRGGELPPDGFYARLRRAVPVPGPAPASTSAEITSAVPAGQAPLDVTDPLVLPTGTAELISIAGLTLSTGQKMALVKALLRCEAMANRQLRDTVVTDLPAPVKQSIRRSDQDRADVNAIVTASLNYPDGLAGLIEVVRFFEEDSFGMRAVDEMLVGIGLAALIPVKTAPPAIEKTSTPAAASPAELPSVTVPATPRSTPAAEDKPAPILRPPTTPIAFDWVEIPAGEFLMGSDPQKDDKAYNAEKPQHRLTLPTFWITRVPVTVAQFAAFVDATGHKMSGIMKVKNQANHPVVNVSRHDAKAFCRWAGVQLPSEAEWEKAARGTDGRIYPWGDTSPDKNRCNFGMNVKDTTPVGQYPAGASPYGLLDMSGNVWEWTRSLWGKDSNKSDFAYPYDPKDGREDLGAPDDVRRVLRGGSWLDSAANVRCAYRIRVDPGDWNLYVGLRLVVPGL